MSLWGRGGCVFLLFVLVLPAVAGGAGKTKPVALKGALSSTQRKIRTVRRALKQAKRSEVQIAAELVQIRVRLARTRAYLRATSSQLARTRREQSAINAQLRGLQTRLRGRENLLARRLAANYRQGPVRYASVVLGARSMGEFVGRAHFVRTIVRHDARLIADIKQDREAVLRAKRQIDVKTREGVHLQQELAARHADESADVGRHKTVLAEARACRAAFEDELNALEADSAAIAARLRALHETPLGRVRRQRTFTGGFLRPVPGGVVSSFGMRFHPLLHRARLHAGIDLAGATGTPIRAAAGGVVVFSGALRGYGNVVVVDHGGGVSTLYAHCSARLVADGQTIARGQAIARVGATGLATGPHLHFEVRKNGAPVNPLGAL